MGSLALRGFRLNAFDRFTMGLAPKWTLERARARAALENYARSYEAASAGRRTSGWKRTKGDANSVNAVALSELRMHARDLIRNNSWAKRPQRIIANNTVGWGIVPRSIYGKEAIDVAATELWKKWAGTTACDTEARHTFYGIQHLAMRTLVASGEVLIRRRRRRPEDGLPIPLQLQVLEPDFLDTSREQPNGDAGGPVIQGIEYDAIGHRAAYWLFPEHPGSRVLTSAVSRRIPASEIAHVFYTERPGEARGVSWYGSAIVNLKDLDEYEDAELMKQKVAASFAAFVTDMEGLGAPIGEEDEDDPTVENVEPGTVSYLPGGKQVTFSNPPTVTGDFFPTRNLRKIAAGLGVTYEDLTGDYSQVNFSSARMGRISHQAHVEDWRWNMLVPQLCAPVWEWAMQAAELAGSIEEATPSDWTCPPMALIEPDKEALGLMRLVRNGVMTFDEMLRELGKDPKRHWAEYAANLKALDSLGIKLDTDVRAVSQAGLKQQDPAAAGSGSAESERAIAAAMEIFRRS